MYAIIKTGGKQYKVRPGDQLKVESLPLEAGSELRLEEVLAVMDESQQLNFGAPFILGAFVCATVVAHGRGPKIRIFKMRRRKHYQKRQGHRQNFTELKIESIQLS